MGACKLMSMANAPEDEASAAPAIAPLRDVEDSDGAGAPEAENTDSLAVAPGHSWLSEDDRRERYAVERTTARGVKLRCVDVGEPHAYNGSGVELEDGRRLLFYRGGGAWPGHRLRYVILDKSSAEPAPRDAGLAGNDEDPRVIRHEGRLLVSAAKYDGYSVRIDLWEAFGPDALGHVRLENRAEFHTVGGWPDYVKQRWEKNWAPFSHGGKFYYVYSIQPHRILEVDLTAGNARLAFVASGDAVRCHELGDPDSDVRLNAPPVRLRDGRYLSTYHVVRQVGERFDYYSGFYTFAGEPPFTPLASTDAFLIPEDAEGIIPHDRRPTRCVFITGMSVDERADQIVLWGGDSDRRVFTGHVALSRVLGALR